MTNLEPEMLYTCMSSIEENWKWSFLEFVVGHVFFFQK